MTIQNTTIRKAGPSQGNGVNVSFPFTFKVFASADVLVTYLDATGIESSLVLSADYTVALNADQNIAPGGTVTLLWTPAMDTYITLTSQVSYTQNLALTNAGGFYPTSINDALDWIVIQVQQLAELISRSAKAPLSGIGSLTASSLVFGVDSSGIPVLSQLASISSTAVSTFMNTLLGLSSASAVKTALSVQSDLQTQANTQVTTTGTSTAYVAVPSPIIATPTANTRLRVKFHLASGVTPTLTVGSVTAALQQYDSTGTLVSATLGSGQLTDVEYNGSVYVVLDPLPWSFSASTGTGAVVLASSPTISSPVISGTPSGVGTLTQGTVASSVSGTSVTFTGIPSWAKRITIMFNGVSTTGTANPVVQIGSGSPLTTGYVGSTQNQTASIVLASATTGFPLLPTTSAASIYYGTAILTNYSGNGWSFHSQMLPLTGNLNWGTGINTTLAGALDRVSIVTTDAFDAGSINIMYE